MSINGVNVGNKINFELVILGSHFDKVLDILKAIASETDARKMKSSVRLGGLKEAPASIGGEYFTFLTHFISKYA